MLRKYSFVNLKFMMEARTVESYQKVGLWSAWPRVMFDGKYFIIYNRKFIENQHFPMPTLRGRGHEKYF